MIQKGPPRTPPPPPLTPGGKIKQKKSLTKRSPQGRGPVAGRHDEFACDAKNHLAPLRRRRGPGDPGGAHGGPWGPGGLMKPAKNTETKQKNTNRSCGVGGGVVTLTPGIQLKQNKLLTFSRMFQCFLEVFQRFFIGFHIRNISFYMKK